MLALEAVAPGGTFLEPGADVDAAVCDMLATFFQGRTDRDLAAVPVNIRPAVRLAGMSAVDRLGALLRPVGEQGAVDFLVAAGLQ